MFFPINNQQSIKDINRAFNSTQHNGNGLNANTNYFLEPQKQIKDKFRQNPKNAKQSTTISISSNDENESDESDESEYDKASLRRHANQEEIHEELLKLRREHYNDNKQHILELQKLSRYRCECGSDVKSKDKQIHLRSKKHRLFCFEKKQD